uniref:Reverse transcriptase domain-containing protein n=1 Tax=Tanacetum cinerariifolium TaxID=118510 RepID=A0A699GW27_TANCI|nr:reverse transcriptase domain-containing protein [Tanacetum cinerariifolium]
MPPKRTSTSTTPAMTQATISQLVADSITTALEAQVPNMANADNTNRNPEPREASVARNCSYKEFMSCQLINFKGSEGVVRLIRWFGRTKSVFSCSNCTEDYKVKFATGTLPEEALSWWNSFAQPIGIEEAYNITWVEFNKLLKKKYCPQTKVQKMEDEFYHLTVKENDLNAYVRRFQELATICPTMVSDSKKMIQVMEKKLEDKQLEDIPVVREFPDIFPEDLPSLPPVRQVEFQINLIPGATPVARIPYRLALSEMQELSYQLQELADQGLPAGHLSWTMGVVGVDKGYYPVDFDGIAGKKSGGKGQYRIGREMGYTVFQTVTGIRGCNFTLLVPVVGKDLRCKSLKGKCFGKLA